MLFRFILESRSVPREWLQSLIKFALFIFLPYKMVKAKREKKKAYVYMSQCVDIDGENIEAPIVYDLPVKAMKRLKDEIPSRESTCYGTQEYIIYELVPKFVAVHGVAIKKFKKENA